MRVVPARRAVLTRELARAALLPVDSGVPALCSDPEALQAPPGFAALRSERVLGRGPVVERAAGEALLTWQVQRGAGIAVTATSPRAAAAVTVLQQVRVAGLALLAPCRVLAAPDQPGRRGYTYATLPGHPEQGEESFLVTTDADGTVTLRITSVSRPAALLARLGAPVTRAVQRRTVAAYGDGVAAAVAAALSAGRGRPA